MGVRKKSDQVLVFVDSNRAFKVIGGVLAAIFALIALDMLSDEFTPAGTALIPGTISAIGVVVIVFGGKPNMTTLDRGRNVLSTETYAGWFSNPVVTEYRLSDFDTVSVERLIATGNASRPHHAVMLNRSNGDSVQLGAAPRWERTARQHQASVEDFLGLTPSAASD